MAPSSGPWNKGKCPRIPCTSGSAPVPKEPQAARRNCQMLSKDCRDRGRQRKCWHLAPPQPLPIMLHVHTPDMPFCVGLSVMCLKNLLTGECKCHRVHKTHSEVPTSPQCCLWLVTGEAAGWRLGRFALHTVCTAHSMCYFCIRCTETLSQAGLLNALI